MASLKELEGAAAPVAIEEADRLVTAVTLPFFGQIREERAGGQRKGGFRASDDPGRRGVVAGGKVVCQIMIRALLASVLQLCLCGCAGCPYNPGELSELHVSKVTGQWYLPRPKDTYIAICQQNMSSAMIRLVVSSTVAYCRLRRLAICIPRTPRKPRFLLSSP